MGRVRAATLVFVVLAAGLVLASCGGGDADLLPGTTASEIESNLDQVRASNEEGDCEGAEDGVAEISTEVDGLRKVDAELEKAVRQAASKLSEVVAGCGADEEAEEQKAAEEGEAEEQEQLEAEEEEAAAEQEAFEKEQKAEERAEKDKEQEKAEKDAEGPGPEAEDGPVGKEGPEGQEEAETVEPPIEEEAPPGEAGPAGGIGPGGPAVGEP